MRTVVMFAIVILVGTAVSTRARDRVAETFGTGGAPGALPAAPSAAGTPREFQQLLSGVGPATRDALRPRAGVLPGLFGSGRPEEGEQGGGPRPFADTGPARQVSRVKRDTRAHLRAVSAVTRRMERDPARAAAVLDRVYSRRVLAAAGPEQRAALAARLAGTASGAAQRLRVAAFQGVFVTGDQAIAILDYAREIRVSSGSRWRELPVERWQVALRREGATWRFERGLER